MPPKTKTNPFVLISGPCVLESEAQALKIGRTVRDICRDIGWRYIFKASYDKANRTSIRSQRGPGIDMGLAILARIREKLDVPVLTDVHSVEEVHQASFFVDAVQIPAFLCRQTDLILAAGESGVQVNVKKGQFLAPDDVDAIAEKLKSAGCRDYFITERGTSFGYHNLVVDMRGLAWMREKGHRVIFDATHSVQRPGSLGGATGGDGKLAPVLARAAVAAGVDGLFIETHPNPSRSPSDGPNMIPLAQMPSVLRQLAKIHEVI
ncbi:MAG: 3-deoxy-8-phosphooctulonate synthase [Methylacidiphilales bacterium]|nr:3-deoxy-8-phosphooctulonate synthase [Candidatus Methylacidiphilales bacterium]